MPLLSLYEKLRTLENELDRAVLQKKLLNEESHHKRIKCTRRLRIFTKYQKFKNSYHFQVEGQIISEFTNSSNIKMTDVLKNIIFKLNNENNKDIIFEWTKKENQHFDSFELTGTEEHDSISLVLFFENTLDKFKLSDPLKIFLEKETDTKTNILIDLWKYIRLNNLITDSNTYFVQCDEKLSEIFDKPDFQLSELPEMINEHLLPLDPLIVEIPTKDIIYNDSKNNILENNFDVRIDMDDFFEFPILYQNNTIFQLEQKIMNSFESLRNLKSKIDTLTKFSEDPEGYIKKWIFKHGVDLKKPHFDLDHKAFYDPLVQQTIFEMMQSFK